MIWGDGVRLSNGAWIRLEDVAAVIGNGDNCLVFLRNTPNTIGVTHEEAFALINALATKSGSP